MLINKRSKERNKHTKNIETENITMSVNNSDSKKFTSDMENQNDEHLHPYGKLFNYRQNALKFEHIFLNSSVAYFIVAADGTIIACNPSGEELFQKTQNELAAFNFKSFLPEKTGYLLDNLISKALISEKKETVETFLNTTGKQSYVKITATSVNSSFECILEILDISHLKSTDKEEIEIFSYKTLIEEASVGIFVADAQGNYISVNKFGCDMLGYSLPEILALNFKDLVSDKELKTLPIKWDLLKTGHTVLTERNIVRKDGTLLPVEISGKVLSDGRLQGIVRDLSKQKSAEVALKESEAHYKHAERIAHLGSWQMDIKTGISKWSDEFFRICGFKPQSFQPNRELRFKVVHPDDRQKSEKAIQQAIESKSSYKIEKRVLRPNGEIRYVLSVGEIILDSLNEPKELKGVFLDITDLKLTELSLKKSEENYKTLLEVLPIGLIIKSNNGNFLYGNNKSRQILEVESLLLKNYRRSENWNLIRKDETPMPAEEFPSNIAINEVRTVENMELGVVLDDNRKVWLNATVAPMPDREEVIIAFMDITEKVIREKQLNELSEKLQELNATKDKFFSIIAHDLKNPFNSILGFSDLIMKNIHNYSYEEIEKFVGIIHDSSQKAYNLLENLLLWSRSQTGTLEYDPHLIKLNDIVYDNVRFIEPMAMKKHIRLVFNKTGEPIVSADKNMIDTVLRNILTNAVKFSYPDGTIEVEVRKNEPYYEISIKDNGIGIEEENIKKIFRLDSKYTVPGTNKEKGSGLGLLICKEFIEKNRGKICVNSEVGKGSEFVVSLPMHENLISK